MIPDIYRVQELAANALHVQERIETACVQCGRRKEDVRLIWVSKTHPIEDIEAAVCAGATDFGENKLQESLEKFSIPRPGITVHLIGPVQSNKWRKAVGVADWIHSAGSLDELLKYNMLSAELGKKLNVLIQVNTSGEPSKSGLCMDNADDFLRSLPDFSHLHLRGLMTIGKNTGVAEDSREGFAWLRGLRDHIRKPDGAFAAFTELSMGMTDDLEIAIAEGSTMVRVGSAIFGKRMYPNRS